MTMVLTTKIGKPTVDPAFVDRPRLYQQLDAWRAFRALVIQAPAGYGKSSLVSRWIEASRLDRQVAWLSLSEEESDLRQFVAGFAAALDPNLPGLAQALQPVLQDPRASVHQVRRRLLAVLEERLASAAAADAAHLLLVIDDLQLARSPEVDDLITKILEYGPQKLHLLLLARETAGLPMARLYGQRRVEFLDKEDMRFTREEVRSYLAQQGFAESSAADIAQLTQQSEGWITALQLAVLSVPQRGNAPDLTRVLQSRRSWIAEFLTDEVLNHQTAEWRSFMLRTSILDRFNAELCAAVTGAVDARATLEAVRAADLFIIGLDKEGEWYRYHHLFQELLQRHLQAEMDADEVAALHRQAGRWLAAEGQIEAASRHLLAGGAASEAASAIHAYLNVGFTREPIRLKRLFDRLPEAFWQQEPELMVGRSFLAIIFDDREALFYTERAVELLQKRGLTAENAPELWAKCLVCSASAHYLVNDYVAFRDTLQQAVAMIDHLDDLYAGTLHFAQLPIFILEGRQDKMWQSGARAVTRYERAGFRQGAISVQRFLAKLCFQQGRRLEANNRFRTLLDDPPLDRHELVDELTWAHVFAAENSYWQNDLQEARQYQRAALHLAQLLQDDVLIVCVEVMGVIYDSDRDADSRPRQELYAEVERIALRAPRELFIDLAIRRLTAAGLYEDAWALAQRIGIDREDTPGVYQHRSLIPYLRAAVAARVDLTEQSGLLEGAIAHHAAAGNRFQQLQLLALKSWQQLKLYGAGTAGATLVEAADLAQVTGYVRILLDIPELSALLVEAKHALAPVLRAATARALELTDREQQVLAYLAEDLTYGQIAEELNVSINTVRTHVTRIYRKLSVSRRRQAVALARREGLLTLETV